jgi:hypothetical protein
MTNDDYRGSNPNTGRPFRVNFRPPEINIRLRRATHREVKHHVENF